MSAIAGILYFDGAPVQPDLIEKLTGAMKRRGPDEQTHWVQGSVALGHCMLRTTPESGDEHQPLSSTDKSALLVWDGRLDNREELRRELTKKGAVLRDNTDPELVLHGYEAWGDDLPKHLLGDFAFALWDTRQKRMFCARDHVGARPFYYTHNERFFAFASEDEALLALPGVTSALNEELIAHFLVPTFLDFDYTRSWLADVRTLPPAQQLSVSSRGNARSEAYWQLLPCADNRYASDAECQEAFLAVFGDAVRCRMRASGPIAAMMSGGMDSAAIAVMAKRLLPETPATAFHTYSTISDHPETCVETQCIRHLTEDLGENAHFVSVPSFTGMLSVDDLIDAGWSQPHPVDNSILLPAMMCLAASRNGHRVMLHGVTGDLATHAPIQYIPHLLLDGRWRQAWHECASASRNHTYLRDRSPSSLLLQGIWGAYVPPSVKLAARKLRANKGGVPQRVELANRAFRSKHGLDRRASVPPQRLPTVQQAHIQALAPPHGIASGMAAYDRVAGRYGVEPRDPWADKRVLEFFVRLPLEYKVRHGWTKYIVRASFAGDLPPLVNWRIGKEHLGWDLVCRLMDETHEWVSDALQHHLEDVSEFVDPDAVREQYARYCSAKGDLERQAVYDTITLIHWVRRLAG